MKQFFISSILVGALALAGCRGRNISGMVAAQGTGNLLEPPAGRVSGLDELAEACDTPEDRHPARTGRLDRAPYLQNASDEGATVVWTSADPQPATVEVSLPDGTAVTSVPSRTEFAEGVIHGVYATVEDDEMRLHAIDATGREFDGVVIPL